MSRGPIPDKPAERPTVPEVLAMARTFLAEPGNELGGPLHVVLEDGNLEDGFLVEIIGECRERGDDRGLELSHALLQMTRTQRANVYATLRAQPEPPTERRCYTKVTEETVWGGYIEVSVSPAEDPYPAMLSIEGELDGSLLPDDAREFALAILAGVVEAEEQNERMVNEALRAAVGQRR